MLEIKPLTPETAFYWYTFALDYNLSRVPPAMLDSAFHSSFHPTDYENCPEHYLIATCGWLQYVNTAHAYYHDMEKTMQWPDFADYWAHWLEHNSTNR